MSIHLFISSKFPKLGIYYRIFLAFIGTLSKKQSYSQHGEDLYIWELIKGLKNKGVYVDVGANHPSRISNTYLFYKKGYSGITIEPNEELYRLHKFFRKRDLSLNIGLDFKCDFKVLNICKTPVLSSFNEINKSVLWKKQYTAILTLDLVIKELKPDFIFLLSIDTEGLNHQVLEGARETLLKTFIVCIEANDEFEENSIKKILCDENFKFLTKTDCNLIYINKSYSFSG